MFKERRTLADVAIELDRKSDAVLDFYKNYLRLTKTNGFMTIYDELKDDLLTFIHLYKRIKKERLTKQDITNLFQNQQRLKDMEKRVELYNDFIRGQHSQKLQLAEEIHQLRTKRDRLDGISPF